MTSWQDIFASEFEQDYFKIIQTRINQEYQTHEVYPPRDKIFAAFDLCPFEKVKVVISGQDCYFNPNQAHGLAFSVNKGMKIPPSLINIYKELKSDLGIEPPTHGCLRAWAKEGVLLLNSALTVRRGEPGSHIEIWKPFTDKIISILNNSEQPIVFILWGTFSRAKKKLINNPKNHLLESAHPSPLSAYNGFFGSKPFSKTNQFLISNKIEPINWMIE